MTQRKTVEPLFGNKVTTLKGITKFWDEIKCEYVTLDPNEGQESLPTKKKGKHGIKLLHTEGIALLPAGLLREDLNKALLEDDAYQQVCGNHFKIWGRFYNSLPNEKLKDALLGLIDPEAERVIAAVSVAYRLGLQASKLKE